MAKGALTSNSSGEGDVRRNLVEKDLIDCIVNLPAKLFLNTQIPASLWFAGRKRARKGEILFIDARNLGFLINRRTRELSREDIERIATMLGGSPRGVTRTCRAFVVPRRSLVWTNWGSCSHRAAMWGWPKKRMILILASVFRRSRRSSRGN